MNGDAGLYVLLSGVLATLLGFLAPLIGKRMQRNTEVAATRRADFETTMEAMRQIVELKDAEIIRCHKERREEYDRVVLQHRTECADCEAKIEDLETRLEARRKDVHLLNNLIQSYVLRFGRIEDLPDEPGGTPK